MRSLRIMRDAREAVIANRFHGGPPPVNPHRKHTRGRIWWDMGVRKAESAIAELMRVGG